MSASLKKKDVGEEPSERHTASRMPGTQVEVSFRGVRKSEKAGGRERSGWGCRRGEEQTPGAFAPLPPEGCMGHGEELAFYA